MQCVPGHPASCEHCHGDGGYLPDVLGTEKLEQTYVAHSAEQSLEKRTRYKQDFVVWGTGVEGRRGRVGVEKPKRQKIARLVFSVALHGSATKAVLRSLVGSLIHPFMHRRC